MARKRSLTGAQQMGFARGDLDPADFNPDEYNSYDAKTIRSTTYAPPRKVTPAPQTSGTMFNLGRVGQDSEMSNRVFQSTIGSGAAPPAVTAPDFSLAAIGANTAGAFPADSGLTQREGTSGASGSYTGPDDIYGWEDGVNTGTVDRLDNGRSWVYRDGMGNVLGEVDKSMARAEREATAGLAPPPEPVIDPEPPPFPEPDPLPAAVDPGPELGQELEGEMPGGELPELPKGGGPHHTRIIDDSQFDDPQPGSPGYDEWLAELPARWASGELPYGWGEWPEDFDPETMVSSRNTQEGPYAPDEEFSRQMRDDLAEQLGQQPRGFYYALDDTGRLRRYTTEEGAEPGQDFEAELHPGETEDIPVVPPATEPELGQDLEEEPPLEEPVVSPVEEPELGQDLEVDLVGTEPPPVISPDGTELVGGLPLVDAYHAMKVGEGPVLTEAQISQLPPELLVEARAWMAANVDGPRQKAVAGPVDEIELGQDLEADLSAEEGVPQTAAKAAGAEPVESLDDIRRQYEETIRKGRESMRQMNEFLNRFDGYTPDPTAERLEMEARRMTEDFNRIVDEGEAAPPLQSRPATGPDAYWGGIPDPSGLQQGPTYIEHGDWKDTIGGEGSADQQEAWRVWENLGAIERGQNWGTTRYPDGDFGYWYTTEWLRQKNWQSP
jgi:hypothetical protein